MRESNMGVILRSAGLLYLSALVALGLGFVAGSGLLGPFGLWGKNDLPSKGDLSAIGSAVERLVEVQREGVNVNRQVIDAFQRERAVSPLPGLPSAPAQGDREAAHARENLQHEFSDPIRRRLEDLGASPAERERANRAIDGLSRSVETIARSGGSEIARQMTEGLASGLVQGAARVPGAAINSILTGVETVASIFEKTAGGIDKIHQMWRRQNDNVAFLDQLRELVSAEKDVAKAIRELRGTPIASRETHPIRHSNLIVTLFSNNSAELLDGERERLVQELSSLRSIGSLLRIEISGHASQTGPRARNDRLASERANSVYKAIISSGLVSSDAVRMKAHSSDSPILELPPGDARNRRVEIEVWLQ